MRLRSYGFCFACIVLFCNFLSYVHADSRSNFLTTCLNSAGILNFTTAESDSEALLNQLYYSLHNLRFTDAELLKPDAIILPQSARQVQQAFACALEGNWSLRVRSGGHSYEGLSSTASAPFVIIDLMNMNNVSVDLTSETAWVEAGATLGEVYFAISQQSSSYGFSAGSCPTVGVSGHISGGGFGLLSRKYGLAADNVIDARVVTANGYLLDSVRSTDPDLFWALLGGGGGTWGIVTAWKIKLLPVPSTVTTFTSKKTGKDLVSKLVYLWQSAGPAAPKDLYTAVYMQAGINNATDPTEIGAKFFGQYLGDINQTLAVVNEIFPELALTAIDCKEGSWIQSVAIMGNVSSTTDLTNRQEPSKNYYKAKSDFVKSALSKEDLAGAMDILENNTLGWMQFDPFGGAMEEISSEAIAFPHRSGNLYGIQYQVVWPDDTGSPGAGLMEWLRSLHSYMGAHVSQSPRAAYVNYLDLDLGDGTTVGPSYYLDNFPRLLQIKSRVDPQNLFANPQSVPVSITGCISSQGAVFPHGVSSVTNHDGITNNLHQYSEDWLSETDSFS